MVASLEVKRSSLKRLGKRALRDLESLEAFRREVLQRDAYVCQYDDCGHWTSIVHHILPRSRGGKHVADNGVALCAEHHRQIHDHTVDDWRKWIG